ncbi:MAG: hypothetical protein RIQ54_61 [Candidatus Parcubacteria bacterium]|jgi:ADP-ribose pyrophosphatase YjhB (NUDIX family)
MHQRTYIALKALIHNEDKFLIVKKSLSDNKNNLVGWETPGGRLEENEDILSGLSREIKEETGLTVEILNPFHAFIAHIGKENCIIGISFIARYKGGKVVIDEKEHNTYAWSTIEEIRNLTESTGLQKELDAFEKFTRNWKYQP